MTRDQAVLAAIAAGAVAGLSVIMALTGTAAMWWTVLVMVLLLVVLVSRLRRGRNTQRRLGPAEERIDDPR